MEAATCKALILLSSLICFGFVYVHYARTLIRKSQEEEFERESRMGL